MGVASETISRHETGAGENQDQAKSFQGAEKQKQVRRGREPGIARSW